MKNKSVEVTDAVINVDGQATAVEAAVNTTQERHSSRAMIRTRSSGGGAAGRASA